MDIIRDIIDTASDYIESLFSNSDPTPFSNYTDIDIEDCSSIISGLTSSSLNGNECEEFYSQMDNAIDDFLTEEDPYIYIGEPDDVSVDNVNYDFIEGNCDNDSRQEISFEGNGDGDKYSDDAYNREQAKKYREQEKKYLEEGKPEKAATVANIAKKHEARIKT